MTTVRRSERAKRQASSIYDEAKEAIQGRESLSSTQSSRSRSKKAEPKAAKRVAKFESEEAETDAESTEEASEREESSDESSSAEEEEEFRAKPRVSPAKKQPKAPVKKIPVSVGRKKAQSTKSRASVIAPQARRTVQSSLMALSRKVLDPSETPQTSLVAALLQSYKTGAPNKKHRSHEGNRTIYTDQLEPIARRVIEQHKIDANKAQADLLNLLFRSVGGSIHTNIDSTQTKLEDMDNEEWAKVVTDLVDEMRHTPADRILLCADPNGAVHSAAIEASKDLLTSDAPSSLGAREYRKIYEEFWYLLGSLGLTEGSTAERSNNDDDSDEEGDHTSPNGFDTDLVRDLIVRVTELVTVGQPDVRAASTIAALQMGHAILNRTVELNAKLDAATRQFKAASAGNKTQLHRKAESYRHQMDSIKRSCADLEELVAGSLVQGVFMHRYRDSNMFIRAACLQSLSRMSLQRHDLFLTDKYLKYFGWMMSDKAACVRVASVAGLNAPFDAVRERKRNSSKHDKVPRIDLTVMDNVLTKFLPRIADCVVDVDVKVQEKAMALLLNLARARFLDDVEDDKLWNQINVRALARDTSPIVRRDALYFVMEQLEAFDEEDDPVKSSSQKHGWSQDKKTSLGQSSERMVVQRLDSLASWVAHTLSDGPIPIERIRVDLADYVVYSLRDMPEHVSLVTNWSAMLRAISDDNTAMTAQGKKAGDRADVAKQRVLVQMLACASQAEVGAVAESNFLASDVDMDTVVDHKSTNLNKKSGPTNLRGMQHESLSVALLQSLADLLVKFRGDPAVLGSITVLPRYLLPSVFSLPQRKNDFMVLVKTLTDIYLESSDDTVLRNIALSLSFLSRGDHARVPDARLNLQRLAGSLSDRMVELLKEKPKGNGNPRNKRKGIAKSKRSAKRGRKSRNPLPSQESLSAESSDEEGDDGLVAGDVEYAVSVCLKRMCVLSKRCNFADLLSGDRNGDETASEKFHTFCDVIVDAMGKRLSDRKVVMSADSEEHSLNIPVIWHAGDQKIHGVVANSVKEALSLLLSLTAWEQAKVEGQDGVLVRDDEDMTGETVDGDGDVEDHIVLQLRNRLISLVELCFEQFLPPKSDEEGDTGYSKEHLAFADFVQARAGEIASDLRSLFPKEWVDASSPLLRAFALTDDGHLMAGFVRYFRSKEDKLRANDKCETENVELVNELLLPLGRCLATNWRQGNRREAGVALAHVTGSGQEASKVIASLSRVLKKIDPVRLLEAHMASLRQSYEDWVENEPEEMDNDRPTDEEMALFEESERRHEQQFQSLEQQASRLSMSLGVGKLSDPTLAPALLGFVREGVRFAFSSDDTDSDDALLLGSRLSFLLILSRYVNWIRRNKEQRFILQRDLDERTAALRDHPDFSEVHEDDLAALASFRAALGVKESIQKEEFSSPVMGSKNLRIVADESDENEDSSRSATMTPSPLVDHGSSTIRHRLSKGSSVRSRLSSTQNSLSPLYEEEGAINESPIEDPSPSPVSNRRSLRQKNASFGSSLSISRMTQSRRLIDEVIGESDDEDESIYA